MQQVTTAWYPDRVEKRYVYLTSLQLEENSRAQEVFNEATNIIETSKASFGGGAAFRQAYSNLQSLISTERSAEESFLASNLSGVTMDQVRAYGFKEMVESFNRILSFESTYRTNIQRVLAMDSQQGGGTGQIDRLYALLNYSLPEGLGKFLTRLLGDSLENVEKLTSGQYDNEILQEASKIIKQEIEKVYGEGGSASAEYVEFAELMQKLLNEGTFVNQVLVGYGVAPEQLRQQLTSTQQAIASGKSKKNQIVPKDLMLQRQGGNMFEIFVNQVIQAVGESFRGNTIATGKLNNMKADHVITIGLGNLEQKLTEMVNQEKGKGEASVRMKNLKAIENFLTDISDLTGSIVFVSDKNYRLDSQSFATQKGFAAETPTFENLEKIVGRAMSKNMTDLEDLIFVLANTGSGRINGEKEDIERYLATMIGNFVFDDVVITDQLNDQTSSVNRIHVFNLGNIYIPLSVFLQAVYEALQNVDKDFSDYVNVHISPNKLDYKKQTDGLTQEDWSKLYQKVISEGHVAFHFFGNFIQFVKQYLQY